MRTRSMSQAIICSRCKHSIPVKNYEIHVGKCLERSKAQDHVKKESHPKRSAINSCQVKKEESKQDEEHKFTCYHCQQNVQIDQIEDHMSKCSKKYVQCRNCGEEILENQLQNHLQQCCQIQQEHTSSHAQQLEIMSSRTSRNHSEQDSQISSYFQTSASGISAIMERDDDYSFEIAFLEFLESRSYRLIFQLALRIRTLAIITSRNDQQEPQGFNLQQIKSIPQIQFNNEDKEQQTCSICYTQISQKEKVKELECKHLFHVHCLSQWLKINRTCPNCKNIIRISQNGLVSNEQSTQSQEDNSQQNSALDSGNE